MKAAPFIFAATAAIKAAPAAVTAAKAVGAVHKFKQRRHLQGRLRRKEVVVMRKSTLAAFLVVFAAIAGGLLAAYCYLRRREAELDEYEQLLFSEDFSEEIPEAYPEEPIISEE